jgi:2-dehydro-3-deoxygluconokinase
MAKLLIRADDLGYCEAVNYGIAHGALAMTTPGDTSMARLKEVENLMGDGSARVQR